MEFNFSKVTNTDEIGADIKMGIFSSCFDRMTVGEIEDEAAWNDPENVSLVVEGRTFRVKKDFLMKQSSYFDAMFSVDMKEAREGIATINETRADIFEKIIQYYDGHSFHLTEDKLDEACSILITASMYQFRTVMEECINFLTEILAPRNCLKIMTFSFPHNFKNLANNSLQFALWEFDSICQQQQFLNLSQVELFDYLDNPNLNTKCEINVLRAVMRWLEKQESLGVEKVEKILQVVRFQSITNADLDSVIHHPVWKDRGCTDVLGSFRSAGWQALYPKKVARKVPWGVCAIGGYHGFIEMEDADHYMKNTNSPHSQISALDLKSLQPSSTTEPTALVGLPMIDSTDQVSYLWGMQTISFGGFIYLFGGEIKTNAKQRWNLDVWRCCIFDQKWCKVTTLPNPRRHHALAAFGDNIYLCGGFGRHRIIQSSVDCFNIRTNKWISIPDMKKPKHQPVASFHNNRLYVIATSVESWAPGERSWSEVDIQFPFHFGVLSLVSLGDGLFLFTRHYAGVFRLFLDSEPISHLQLATLTDCPLSACLHEGEVYLLGGRRTNYVCKVKFGEVIKEEIMGKVSCVHMEHSACMLPFYPPCIL